MLSPAQVDYLLKHRVARLATVDLQHRPHAVPVCFALMDGLIYTPLDQKPKRAEVRRLRRVRNLEHNPAVTLLVDDYAEDWSRLSWLQVRGRAELVEPGEEQGRAIIALRERYEQYRTMALDGLPVIRITPERIVEWAPSVRPG